MVVQIPDDEVVLSDEPNWTTFVLNNRYFDNGRTEEEWEREHDWFDSLPYNEQKEEILTKSWDKVFDIEPFSNDWFSKGFYVQATFWEVKWEYLRDVKFFTSK